MTVRRFRLLPYLLAFALGVGAAAGLAACGGSTSKALIPSADAGPLKDDFDNVASAVADGDCPGADKALAQAQADLDQLPARVSKRLRNRIQQGIARLRTQASQECQDNQTDTETVPTETVPTETVAPPTTTTPPPTTTTPPPTTTTPPPTTPTTPPSDNGGVTVP
jgi:hypothetical protein